MTTTEDDETVKMMYKIGGDVSAIENVLGDDENVLGDDEPV